MLIFKRLKWIEGQIQWLTERFYERERGMQNRYEARIAHLESRLELTERIVEFLKVAEQRAVPAPHRPLTDADFLPDRDFDGAGSEDEMDEGLDADNFPGDIFPTASIQFDVDGELVEVPDGA